MRIIDRLMEGIKLPEGKPVEIEESEGRQKLVELAEEYLNAELKLDFQLKPERCFEFGRRMRRKYSISLKDVEELVNSVIYEIFEEKIGEIRAL